ncbi:response regulator [Planctomicrobium sp. SH661]|uniref:response regulator n=1 Tax=Planctomicrobium sp. SH661 TaxID=3448124 RepID=UPI003F5C0D5E
MQSAHAEVTPRRILLVDDNVGATRIQTMLLVKMGGHEVKAAHDGQSALQLAEEWQPEIVLLDIGLPVMNGYQVAEELRKRPHADSLLLVALTGYGSAEDQERSLQAGFDMHLVKPPSIDQLRAIFSHPKLRAVAPEV